MYFLQVPLTPTVPNDSIPIKNPDWSTLKTMSLDDLLTKLINNLVEFTISLAIAIFIFYAGKFIIKKLYNLTASILIRREVDKSLSTFILSLIRIVLYFILIVTVIGILGINTSSFIAIFASVGVAIGMALSGTLQNFAGGVLILLLKPYKIGDYIEAQGFAGTVTEIQIFSTIICTADNKSIIIPNGGLSTGTINNWSREDYRRVQWTISITYGDDVALARQVILDLLATDDRIVKQFVEDDREYRKNLATQLAQSENPNKQPETIEAAPKRSFFKRIFSKHKKRVKSKIESWEDVQEFKLKALMPKVDRSPSVNLGELADSSINLYVRAWVQSSEYWSVYFKFNELIYNELPKQGISFPFPQMDVHLIRDNQMS